MAAMKQVLVALFVATVLMIAGCGGHSSAPLPEGEEYLITTWYPFGPDEVQRTAAIAICEKFGTVLLRRDGYRFWTYLTPEKVVAMEQDERVAGVGDYFVSIAKPYRGNLAHNVEIANAVTLDFGIQITDTIFSHYFSVQMSVPKAAAFTKDPRIEFAVSNSIGGGAAHTQLTGARQ